MGRLLVLLFLVHLAMAFAAIVDCLGGEEAPAKWSRFGWSLVILFGLYAGPIAWFTNGRPGRKLAMPWSTPDPQRPPSRPVAPDDDPEFLRDLERWRRSQPRDVPAPEPEPRPGPESESLPEPEPEKRDDIAPDERNNGTGG